MNPKRYLKWGLVSAMIWVLFILAFALYEYAARPDASWFVAFKQINSFYASELATVHFERFFPALLLPALLLIGSGRIAAMLSSKKQA